MLKINVRRYLGKGAPALVGLGFAALLAAPPVVNAQTRNDASIATPEVQWNRALLKSGRAEQLAGAIARDNRTVQESVDDTVISRIRKSLPSLDQLGSSLKYGSFSVVSSQGAEVVSLIHTVPLRTGKDRNEALAKLVRFSQQGVPEAQNFAGFVYEYGLFGAARNVRLAHELYSAAASRRYQPAIFNLANLAYFGKDQPSDTEMALELIQQAFATGPEGSNRVCGLASFIEYRRGDVEAALRYGKLCASPLAHIPNAAYNNQLPLKQRIKMLRDSIGTGALDGYRWLEVITQQAGPDKEYLYCKYRLLNQLRANPHRADLKTLARTCYADTVGDPHDKGADMAILAMTSFVATEWKVLEQLPRTNRFHYSWSVPYLPFKQGDVDLFEPVMRDGK
jgi:hypothetical protein